MLQAGWVALDQVLLFSYKMYQTTGEGQYIDRQAKSTLKDSHDSRCFHSTLPNLKLANQL